jgi:hypothetical protein
VRRETARIAPEWTQDNMHDPGTAVLELLAYVLDDLRYRTIDMPGRALARRVAERADSLAGESGTGDCPPGLQRVNCFAGSLLTAEDLSAEQNYFRQRLQRRNRELHGAGVVSGLQVSIERDGRKTQLAIAPGLAFDALGRELEVTAPARLPLPAQGKPLLVLLHYAAAVPARCRDRP